MLPSMLVYWDALLVVQKGIQGCRAVSSCALTSSSSNDHSPIDSTALSVVICLLDDSSPRNLGISSLDSLFSIYPIISLTGSIPKKPPKKYKKNGEPANLRWFHQPVCVKGCWRSESSSARIPSPPLVDMVIDSILSYLFGCHHRPSPLQRSMLAVTISAS